MSKISKTAKASQVQEKHDKKIITDEELIRLLRIDRSAGLYPTVQAADALLRSYDILLESNKAIVESHKQQVQYVEEIKHDMEELRHQLADAIQENVDLNAENARLVNGPCEEVPAS